jgi:hypothetical protein
MTDFLSLDQLIAQLQGLKDSGVPGSTPTTVPSANNEGRSGYVQRIERARLVPVAKTEMEKGFGLLRMVSARGVQVVVVG